LTINVITLRISMLARQDRRSHCSQLWLFRIAHNTAMDFLRRYEHRNVDATADIEVVVDMVKSTEPEERGPDGERVEAALRVFAVLPPMQHPRARRRRPPSSKCQPNWLSK
jgi:DNA-directed RNA polymerase specialized sigma24 family protein